MKHLIYASVLSLLLITNFSFMDNENEEIRLIVRADDMGFSKSANLACIKGYKEGIITTVEVIVPGPWFLDAAKLLRENPGLDVGIHLTLTSEWDNYKWGPLTQAESLVTRDRYFHTRTEQVAELEINPDELDKELRAQIELALKYIPQVSHISDHMNVATCQPAVTRIFEKLSEEYKLPLGPTGLTESFELWAVPPEEKEDTLAESVKRFTSGLYECICHPAFNNEETRGIEGSENDADIRMAIHREAATKAVTSNRIKNLIKNRNIKLVGYSDTYR